MTWLEMSCELQARVCRLGSLGSHGIKFIGQSCKQNDVSVFWCIRGGSSVKLGYIKATRSVRSPCPADAVSWALEVDELCGWSFPYFTNFIKHSTCFNFATQVGWRHQRPMLIKCFETDFNLFVQIAMSVVFNESLKRSRVGLTDYLISDRELLLTL